jgi:hypothetical protein
MRPAARGEFPATPWAILTVQGSFDYVAPSLREAATPLRMTV